MTVRTDEVRSHANLIWSIAELLRGDYKRSEYGRVILPLVVARRLDQVLLPTKAAVLARAAELEAQGIQNIEPPLLRTAGQPFFNRSSLVFSAVDEGIAGVQPITADPANVGQNLRSYVDRFSSIAKQVFDHFDFERQTERLDRANLAYQVVSRVCEVDLHPPTPWTRRPRSSSTTTGRSCARCSAARPRPWSSPPAASTPCATSRRWTASSRRAATTASARSWPSRAR
ncbi:MAG: type I restriction-modification system subunit M N-terminal domain-containing protein [Actinomycetota bacterium]|nr:type I restriction-modification system subunit M N-terminal domain-containing protein [Actinomycetota bacterium]